MAYQQCSETNLSPLYSLHELQDYEQNPGQVLMLLWVILLCNTKVNKINLTVSFSSYAPSNTSWFYQLQLGGKIFSTFWHTHFNMPGCTKKLIHHWVTSVSSSSQWCKTRALKSGPDPLGLQTEKIHFKASSEDKTTLTVWNTFKCLFWFISAESSSEHGS